MQAAYTGALTQHQGNSLAQAFKDELNDFITNAKNVNSKTVSLAKVKNIADSNWDIAIILDNSDTISVEDGDNNILIELVKNLPQAMQAYHNITNNKTIAVVTKSDYRSSEFINKSILFNKVGRQDSSGTPSWYSIKNDDQITQHLIVDIFVHLFALQAMPSCLQTFETKMKIKTIRDFVSKSDLYTTYCSKVYSFLDKTIQIYD